MRKLFLLALLVNAALLAAITFQSFSGVEAGGEPVASENGDTNGDGTRDLSDAVALLSWLFQGGPEPVAIEAGGPPAVPGFTFSEMNEQGYPEYTHDQTGIVFVRLPGGDFDMGSVDCEEDRFDNEGPVHRVRLSPFLIAKYECTQAQYEAVMGSNPSFFTGDDSRPVELVSWTDLKAPEGFLARTGLALPSEAQWEYACRAGLSGPHSGTGNLDEMGWFSGNSEDSTQPVGQKLPNQFGLHDMHGNVWEWCEDVHNNQFYSSAAASRPNPVSRSGSTYRARRGGGWDSFSSYCRSALRRGNPPDFRNSGFGFRPLAPLP